MEFAEDRMAREYARRYTRDITISLGKEENVAKISVVLTYSYTDSRVVISSFSCTPSILKKGNSISIHDKKITNGSPAMASVRYTVSNSTTKQSRASITYFAVGISGDVRVQTVPLN